MLSSMSNLNVTIAVPARPSVPKPASAVAVEPQPQRMLARRNMYDGSHSAFAAYVPPVVVAPQAAALGRNQLAIIN